MASLIWHRFAMEKSLRSFKLKKEESNMKKLITIQTVVVAILVSTSVWADTHGEDQDSASMPMMNKENSGMMMNPQMMESMMAQGQQHNMHMMYKMMHQANAMRQDHSHGHHHGYQQSQGMPMSGGMGNMMMNPQMMKMRMQHMANMEQRLKNIESLLTELVEQAKAE